MPAAQHKKAVKLHPSNPKGALAWLLVSLVVLAALSGMMSGNYLPKIFWAALTVGLGLILIPPCRGRAISISRLGAVWAAYLGWALLSLLWAIQPQVGLERWLVMLLLTLAYLLAGRTRFWESRVFWRGFSLIAGLAALIGILQYYLPSFSPVNYFPGTAVPRGTMGHRNYAGMYFMVTLPFLARYYFSARKKEALLPFAALVLGSGFLLLAKTRGAWLGLAGGVAFFFLAGGGKKLAGRGGRAAVLAGAFLVILCFAIAVKPPEPVARLMAGKADLVRTARTVLDPSNRLEFWRGVPGVTHPLFGAGFGNFPIVATPLEKDGKVKTLNWEVHNDYLQAYVDLGIPGAVLFLAFFALLVLLAWRGREQGILLAAGASMVGLAVMQFTVFTMEVVSTQAWMAGVAAILNREAGLRPRRMIPIPAGAARLANYLAALFLLLLAAVSGLTIRGDREFRRRQVEINQVLSYQEILRDPARLPAREREQVRWELEHLQPLLRKRLHRLADRILPTMFFDANMRHISCHQFAGLALALDDSPAAEKFAREALELHPHDRTSLTYLAAIALREERFEAGEKYLRQGVEIFGPNPYLPFFGETLARFWQSRGDFDRARELREKMEAHRVIPPAAPWPPTRTRSVAPEVILDWEDSPGAISYDLYLWPAEEKNEFPPPIATGIRSSRFGPRRALQPKTVYIWRVRAVGRYGRSDGRLWTFRTL